jgi:hypothetical protein
MEAFIKALPKVEMHLHIEASFAGNAGQVTDPALNSIIPAASLFS